MVTVLLRLPFVPGAVTRARLLVDLHRLANIVNAELCADIRIELGSGYLQVCAHESPKGQRELCWAVVHARDCIVMEVGALNDDLSHAMIFGLRKYEPWSGTFLGMTVEFA